MTWKNGHIWQLWPEMTQRIHAQINQSGPNSFNCQASQRVRGGELEGVRKRLLSKKVFLGFKSLRRFLEGKKALRNLRKPSKNPFCFSNEGFGTLPPSMLTPSARLQRLQFHQKYANFRQIRPISHVLFAKRAPTQNT